VFQTSHVQSNIQAPPGLMHVPSTARCCDAALRRLLCACRWLVRMGLQRHAIIMAKLLLALVLPLCCNQTVLQRLFGQAACCTRHYCVCIRMGLGGITAVCIRTGFGGSCVYSLVLHSTVVQLLVRAFQAAASVTYTFKHGQINHAAGCQCSASADPAAVRLPAALTARGTMSSKADLCLNCC
jgi:hypothetical protein